MAPDRLWGVPGAEVLYEDAATAYEMQIEPWADEDRPAFGQLEEWTAAGGVDLLPSADAFLEHLTDWIGETEDFGVFDSDAPHDALVAMMRDPKVQRATEMLRRRMARHVTWLMARKLVASHKVTWGDADAPLLDGEPLYRPAGAEL